MPREMGTRRGAHCGAQRRDGASNRVFNVADGGTPPPTDEQRAKGQQPPPPPARRRVALSAKPPFRSREDYQAQVNDALSRGDKEGAEKLEAKLARMSGAAW